MVHEMGKNCGLRLASLKRLFPTGYLRGACKLAGLTYSEEGVHSSWLPAVRMTAVKIPLPERVYRVNYRGFLLYPEDWDEEYAVFKAREMGIQELTQEHWQVLKFLRKQFVDTGRIPTVYETCEENGLQFWRIWRGCFRPDITGERSKSPACGKDSRRHFILVSGGRAP